MCPDVALSVDHEDPVVHGHDRLGDLTAGAHLRAAQRVGAADRACCARPSEFLFGRHGQVGERWPVRPIGEELPPFVTGQVAVRDLPSEAFPGCEIHVPQHHAAAAGGHGQRGAVGAEGHPMDVALGTASGFPHRRARRLTSHGTTPPPLTPPP